MKNTASILKICVIALLLNTTVLAWSSSDLHLTQRDVLGVTSFILAANAAHAETKSGK